MRSYPCTCRFCHTDFQSYSRTSTVCEAQQCRASLELMRALAEDVEVFDPLREKDHVDCHGYDKCLDLAARNDSPHVCRIDCQFYRPVVHVMSSTVRSNWSIEAVPPSRRPLGGRDADAELSTRESVARKLEPRTGQQLELGV